MSATPPRRLTPARIVLLLLGVVVTLIALVLLAVGGVLIWAQQTQRNDQGYFMTSTKPFVTSSYALATRSLDVAHDGPDWLFESGRLGRVRIDARSKKPIFVGIARAAAVARYLRNTDYTEVKDVDYDPFRTLYVPHSGPRKPRDPLNQHIWVARAGGPVFVTLTWPIEKGRWSVVLLNADGTRGVEADVSVGAKITWLVWLIVAVLAAGTLVLFAGGLLTYLGVRRPVGVTAGAAVEPALPPAVLEAQTYPVAVEGELDSNLSRWLWLVKWFLAIPHYVVLAFLWVAFFVLTMVAFFGILFTGRYPRGIFEVNVGILRWTWRVIFYAFVLGTDRYPPFTLDPVEYPATIEIPYPERLSRGLVLVKWWLLAIPHYLVLSVLTSVVRLLAIFAGVVLLFTGQYPPDFFRLVLGIERWYWRVVAYASLMRDEYPPFKLDR